MKSIWMVLLATCVFGIGSARADDPKGYRVNLPAAAIGQLAIDEGDYRLLLHRDELKVQLKKNSGGDVVDIPAKVVNADSKFDNTQVVSHIVDGKKQITEIRIGGTTLVFDFKSGS